MRLSALLLAAGLTPTPAQASSCASPPASWGSDWSAYAGWCRGCCGTFVRSGTQSRCDPGPNWGCRAAGAPAAVVPAVPATMEGAVLKGVQSGIQQGLQNAAQQRQRQAAENARQLQRMLDDRAALEADELERASELERRRKAADDADRREEAVKTKATVEGMRGLGKSAGLKPKDLSRRTRAKPADALALDCAMASVYSRFQALGPRGAELARGLKGEVEAVLADLRAKPPSGAAGAATSVSVGRDSADARAGGETQLVASVLFTRDEATGELRLSVQHSVSGAGAAETAGQTLVSLDRAGRLLEFEGTPEAEACLRRLAR